MNVLIIRLSAMGDVAISIPVIKTVCEKYPDTDFFMLTNKLFNPFFKNIQNITLINPELKGKHHGFLGLYKLYKEIKREFEIDLVIDLHDVIRSKVIRNFFKFSGAKTYKIDKGRDEKQLLTRKVNKILKQLKHSAERYMDVFIDAGFKFKINKNLVSRIEQLPSNFKFYLETKKIGIAPFAMHKQKQYPIEKVEKLIDLLNNKKYEIFILGGGSNEKKIAELIQNKFENVSSLIGKYSLEEEIEIISNLNLMISMDSSNMHIAALTGIKIVSIWGATHPFAGFIPFISDNKSFIVQNENLSCRPCSVYGNKECYKGTLECFDIKPIDIFNVCEKALKT